MVRVVLREVSKVAHLEINKAVQIAVSKVDHPIKIMDKIILRVKAVLAVLTGNRETRMVQIMAKVALVVKVAHKVISKVAQMGKITAKAVLLGINRVVSKVALAAKAMAKVVHPGTTVLHQTSKTVAGTAVHLIKVANASPLDLIPS